MLLVLVLVVVELVHSQVVRLSGATQFTGGLTANTISATTYLNLPITTDIRVTGGTYSNGTTLFKIILVVHLILLVLPQILMAI
jgi:hypothetical protein